MLNPVGLSVSDKRPRFAATPFAPRILGDRLRDLWTAHPAWVMAAHQGDCVYCLAGPAIDALALDNRSTPPPLDAAQGAAERAFTALCSEFRAVGVHHGRLITGTPLNERPPAPDRDLLEYAKHFGGWTDADVRAAEAALSKAAQPPDRMKGYAGWLLTEPAFLAEAAGVRQAWEHLPAARRPSFPLNRPVPDPDYPAAGIRRRRVPAVQAFGDCLVGFLDKWALTGLATWDLPVPQGPLVPNLLPPHSPAFPRHGVHITLPMYYPLTGDDEMLAEVLRLQQEAARALGVGPSAAGLPHHQAYAQLLDVLHLERAVRSRFPGPKPPRGLATRIVAAGVTCLELSEDQVTRYRKAIARCLRGERDQVPFLRVAASARRRA